VRFFKHTLPFAEAALLFKEAFFSLGRVFSPLPPMQGESLFKWMKLPFFF